MGLELLDICLSCKISPAFEFKFKQKFLLNFLAKKTISKPNLFFRSLFYMIEKNRGDDLVFVAREWNPIKDFKK